MVKGQQWVLVARDEVLHLRRILSLCRSLLLYIVARHGAARRGIGREGKETFCARGR